MPSLNEDLLKQVTKLNSTIEITDSYPMESVIFYLGELDVAGIEQFLPEDKDNTVRIDYVAADAKGYEFILGNVYSSMNEYHGRMFVANQELVAYMKSGQEWQVTE